MSLLNFDPLGPSPKGQKKSLKIVLGIGALVGTIALGSTLASSITLNSGAPVEFGQGVAQTTACDDEVKVTPISSFSNDEESGFKFTGIALSDLDGTPQTDPTDKGCAGKTFTIKSYDSGGDLLTPTYSISLASDGSFSSPDGDTDGNGTESDPDSSVKLTFDSPSIDAESVYRITIESSSNSEAALITGPGGGIVFYHNASGFDCGPDFTDTCYYLEVAPSNWNGGGDLLTPWATGVNTETKVLGIAVDDGGVDDVGVGMNNLSAAIGLGFKNSVAIVAQNGAYDSVNNRYAAGAARQYGGGGFSDWYLPTTAELNQLCKFAGGQDWVSDTTLCTGSAMPFVGLYPGFEFDYFYWSSSERNNHYAWYQYFGNGGQWAGDPNKGDVFLGHVRPIRAY